MVMKLDQLVNGAINVGFGAAAVAVEGGKKVLDDLNTKGEQVRKDTATPDIARSVSDMFEQAGGTISDLTERLGMQGETAGPARARRAHPCPRPRYDRPRAHGLPGPCARHRRFGRGQRDLGARRVR